MLCVIAVVMEKNTMTEIYDSHMPDESKYDKNNYIDLSAFPPSLSREVKGYLYESSFFMNLSDLPKQQFYLNVIARFLNYEMPSVDSFLDQDTQDLQRKFLRWLYGPRFLKLQMEYNKEFQERLQNRIPLVRTLELLCLYTEALDTRDEVEKDIWQLDKLPFPCRMNLTHPTKYLKFTKIKQKKFRNQVKQAFQLWIRQYAVSTLLGRLYAINLFSEFLYQKHTDIEEAQEIDRNIIEEYLYYNLDIFAGKSRSKNNISALKSLFETLGRIYEDPALENTIIVMDIPSVPKCKFTVYNDEEQKTWSTAIKYMEEQKGRALVLHMMLGTRISEVLMLSQDCVFKRGKTWWIRIDSQKSKNYFKPITYEIKMLIDKAIAYTKNKYPDSSYVFTCDFRPELPMQYNSIRYHMERIIKKYNLRDKNGELFRPKTHIFRHCYGVKLTEMHIDDLTIARMLGHANTDSVHFYRRMGSKAMADDTRKSREKMDEILINIVKGWDGYEI